MSAGLDQIKDTLTTLEGEGFDLMSLNSSIVEMRRKSDGAGLQILRLDSGQWRVTKLKSDKPDGVETLAEIGEVEKWALALV